MKIVVLGLSISSAWGNGHATTYRALCKALHNRKHDIVFFERNVEWYEQNRDLPDPPYCTLRLFETWKEILPAVRRNLRAADVVVVGSYFPDGIAALDEVLESNVPVKAFYDIDTPITIAGLRTEGRTAYLLKRHLPELDVYFSFTGGPMLQELEAQFGVPMAAPLYCSVDPENYYRKRFNQKFRCDLSYLGTYAEDRQATLKRFLCLPAEKMPDRNFIVAGSQYPETISWPGNVKRISHLNPQYHSDLYSSSRLILNVTRKEMINMGYSPSVRLFEAAACAAAMVSDSWTGLDEFFAPGSEILLPETSDDVCGYITNMADSDLRRIGRAAQERVLASHTANIRAQEFEDIVETAMQKSRKSTIAG